MRTLQRRLQQLAERPMVLTAGVVVLLAVGALGLALRDQVEVGDQTFRPDPTPALLVLLGGCLITALIVFAVMPKQRATGPPRKRTNPWAQVLGLAIVLLLFYLAVQFRPERSGAPSPAFRLPGGDPGTGPGQGGGLGAAEQGAGLALGTLLALAIVATVGLALWQTRRVEIPASGQTEAEDLRQVIAAGQTALAEQTDPRSAVIAAYAAMEDALVRAGLQRRIADTPSEVLARAGRAGLFGPSAAAAAAELTELFERARFSDRPMPLGAREYAERALAGMDADLEAAIARANEEKLAAGTSAGVR